MARAQMSHAYKCLTRTNGTRTMAHAHTMKHTYTYNYIHTMTHTNTHTKLHTYIITHTDTRNDTYNDTLTHTTYTIHTITQIITNIHNDNYML